MKLYEQILEESARVNPRGFAAHVGGGGNAVPYMMDVCVKDADGDDVAPMWCRRSNSGQTVSFGGTNMKEWDWTVPASKFLAGMSQRYGVRKAQASHVESLLKKELRAGVKLDDMPAWLQQAVDECRRFYVRQKGDDVANAVRRAKEEARTFLKYGLKEEDFVRAFREALVEEVQES